MARSDRKLSSFAQACTLFAMAGIGPVQAQTELDACKRVIDGNERGACYDHALDRKPDATPDKPLRAAEIKAAFADDHKDDDKPVPIFVRASPALGSDNDDPAKVALTRSGGRTLGTVEAALIYGFLDGREDFKKKVNTPYAGLGAAIDKSDPAKPQSTRSARAGWWRLLRARGPDDAGAAVASDFAVEWQSDRVALTQRGSLEADVEYSYRDHITDPFLRLRGEQIVRAGITLYADRVLKAPVDPHVTRSGAIVRLGAATKLPTGRGLRVLIPTSVEWLSGYTREFNGDERHQSRHGITVTWALGRGLRSDIGLELERSIGGNFRAGEPDAAKTTAKLTVKY